MEADSLDCKTEPNFSSATENELDYYSDCSIEDSKLDFDSSEFIKYEPENNSSPFEEVSCKRESEFSNGLEASSSNIETVYLESDTSQFVAEGGSGGSNLTAGSWGKETYGASCVKCSVFSDECFCCFFSCKLCGEPCPTKNSLMRHVCRLLREKTNSHSEQGINKHSTTSNLFRDKISMKFNEIFKKACNKSNGLEQNSESHSNKYECRICKKIYSENSELQQHDCEKQPACIKIDVDSQSDNSPNVEVVKNHHVRKKTFCPYCFKEMIHFRQHLMGKHCNIASIKDMGRLPEVEKLKFIKALIAYGKMILSSKVNKIGPANGPSDESASEECITSSDHKKYSRCHHEYCATCPTKNGNCLSTAQIDEICSGNREFYDKLKIKKEVFPKMRDDKISKLTISDTLICTYAEMFMSRRNDVEVKKLTSHRMREMGRLLHTLRNTVGVKNLLDALKPRHFDDFVAATKTISGYNEETKTFNSRDLPRLIRSRLIQVCDVASKMEECKKSEGVLRDVQKMRSLIHSNWSAALNLNRKRGRRNTGVESDTDDVILVDEDLSNKKRKCVEYERDNGEMDLEGATKSDEETCIPCTDCNVHPKSKNGTRECNSSTMQVSENRFPESEFYNNLELRKEVFPTICDDKLYKIALNDTIIFMYGEYLLSRLEHPKTIVLCRMREMAQLLLALQKTTNIENLCDALRPQYFDDFVAATKTIAGYDEETKTFKSHNLPPLIGSRLKSLCDIASQMNVCKNSEEKLKDIEKFKRLIDSNWSMATNQNKEQVNVNAGDIEGVRRPGADVPPKNNNGEGEFNLSTMQMTENCSAQNRYYTKFKINEEVILTMQNDEISKVAMKDAVIRTYGEYLFSILDQANNVVSFKMREVARLLLALQKITDVENLCDALKPQYFDDFIAATKAVTGYDEKSETFKSPSLPPRLGRTLKRLCDIASKMDECKKSERALKDLKELRLLIEVSWCLNLYHNKGELKDVHIDSSSMKELPCKHCNKTFMIRSNLMRHMAMMHKKKKSDAPEVSFKSLNELDDHSKGRKILYNCPLCKIPYSLKSKLYHHLQADHSGQTVPNYEPPEEIQTDNPLDHNSDEEIITQGNENKPNICLVEPSVTTSTITNGSPPVVPFETVELQSSHDECNDSEMTIEDEIKIDTTDLKNEQLDPDDSMLETIDLTDDADDKEDARKGVATPDDGRMVEKYVACSDINMPPTNHNEAREYTDQIDEVNRKFYANLNIKREMIPIMPNDKVSTVATSDALICTYAKYLVRHKPTQTINIISCRMRQLARLLLKLQDTIGIDNLCDALKPQYFYDIVTATKAICECEQETETSETIGLLPLMGSMLRAVCDVASTMNESKKSTKALHDIKKLRERINVDWNTALDSNQKETENVEGDSGAVEILVFLDDEKEEREKEEETVYVTVADKEIEDVTFVNRNENSVDDASTSEEGTSIKTKRLLCEYCHEIFQTNIHLKKHIATDHNIGTSKTYSKVISRTQENYTPYICGICKEGYTLQSQLDKHMLKEHSKHSLVCKACGRLFKSQELLKDHWQQHIIAYECQICNRSYSQESELDLHFTMYHLNKTVKAVETRSSEMRNEGQVSETREIRKDTIHLKNELMDHINPLVETIDLTEGVDEKFDTRKDNHNSDKEVIAHNNNKTKLNSGPLEASVVSTTVTVTNISTPTVKVEQEEPYSSPEECNDMEMTNQDEISKTREVKVDITDFKYELSDADDPLMEMIDLNEDDDEECKIRRAVEEEANKDIIKNDKIKTNNCPMIKTTRTTDTSADVDPVEGVESQFSREECSDSEMTVEDEIKLDAVYLKCEMSDSDNPLSEMIDLTEDADEEWGNRQEPSDQQTNTEKLFVLVSDTPQSDHIISTYKMPGTGKFVNIRLPKNSTVCELCDRPFSSRSLLKRHIVEVHMNLRPYRCSTCNKAFQAKSSLKTHEAQHTNHRPFVCEVCKKAYVCRSHLKRHLETHAGKMLWFCRVCLKVFPRSDLLEKHLALHAPIDKPPEEMNGNTAPSDKTTPNTSQLEISVISTSVTNTSPPMLALEEVEPQSSQEECNDIEIIVENEFKMDTTDLSCEVLDADDPLSEMMDLDEDVATRKEPESTKIQATPVSMDSESDHFLSKHTIPGIQKSIKVNLRRGTTKCDICGKTYANTCLLKRHIVNIHMNIRPFQCNVCNKTFHEKAVLKVHEAQHTNHRPYVCEVCNKSYICKHHLRRHMLSHKKGKPFVCDVCEKSFKTLTCLKQHASVHDKKFHCTICGVSYASKHSLIRHTSDKHLTE